MASQITSIWTVCLAVCSGVYQIKHKSSTLMALYEGKHRLPGFGNGSMSTTGDELVLCTKEMSCIGFNSLRSAQSMVFSIFSQWKFLYFDSNWFSMRPEQNVSILVAISFKIVRVTVCYHWIKCWLGAVKAISHYLNQCWPSTLTRLSMVQHIAKLSVVYNQFWTK